MKLQYLVLAASLALPAGMAFADGDAVAGAAVFKKNCMACHTATEAKNKVGPTLMGIVGRPVATVEGFKYSKAMTAFGADGKVWSAEELALYLPKPRDLVKGTTMSFAGLKKPEDIANLVAYLQDPAAAGQ